MNFEARSLLLVEDNKIDILNLSRALSKCGITNPLHVARTGEAAFLHLRGLEGHVLAPTPGLILLDLNMPIMNGLEFLAELKGDPRLRAIPVVVLTTSSEKGDRRRAFDLGVAGYFIKPMAFSEFVELIRVIALYWNLSEQP